MRDYILMTDSTIDLTPEMIAELKLKVIPLQFTMDDTTYTDYNDHREMSCPDFYNHLKNGKLPTTSLINTSRFIDFFEPELKNGKDILYICFSSGLSGTYNSSRLAVEELSDKYPDRIIKTVDSKAATMGEGLLVYLASKQKESGQSLDEVYQWVINNRDHICHQFTVNDLFHLHRGGRVSKAAATIGTMLSIKPVLHVDNDGKLLMIDKTRGRKQSIKSLFKKMKTTIIEPENQTIFISHGDCLDEAKILGDMITKEYGVTDIHYNYVGPVIGAHAGPGIICLFYYGSEK